MIALILAGGLGSRLKSITGDMPKCLVPIDGVPLIGHQLGNLKKYGINDVVILTGYGHDKIRDFCGNGERWSLNIRYVREPIPIGTAGALRQLKGQIADDALLVSGDILFDICLSRMYEAHIRTEALATVAAHPSDHPYDSNLLEVGGDGFVEKWHIRKNRQEADYFNLTNLSLQILSPEFIKEIPDNCFDLWDDALPMLIMANKKIFAYRTSEFIRDMGTPERYYKALEEYRSGLAGKRNLNNMQKAIFIDRDGVTNRHKDYITRPEQIELVDGSAEAIKIINNSEFLAICVTNQAQVGKGMCDLGALADIHKRLETLLARNGAYLDNIYFCPHDHGENCNCRQETSSFSL